MFFSGERTNSCANLVPNRYSCSRLGEHFHFCFMFLEMGGSQPRTRLVLNLFQVWRELYERPPKPPTFWNSYTRPLILDTIMKLSGTIGVTQKTMTLDTHVRLILLQTLNPQER